MVNASQRGRSNQRKGGYHERKNGKRLGELTGLTFERNLDQRREADHLGDLICKDADFPFVIENKYGSKGNGIPSGAWEQACRGSRTRHNSGPQWCIRMAALRRAVVSLWPSSDVRRAGMTSYRLVRLIYRWKITLNLHCN